MKTTVEHKSLNVLFVVAYNTKIRNKLTVFNSYVNYNIKELRTVIEMICKDDMRVKPTFASQLLLKYFTKSYLTFTSLFIIITVHLRFLFGTKTSCKANSTNKLINLLNYNAL